MREDLPGACEGVGLGNEEHGIERRQIRFWIAFVKAIQSTDDSSSQNSLIRNQSALVKESSSDPSENAFLRATT